MIALMIRCCLSLIGRSRYNEVLDAVLIRRPGSTYDALFYIQGLEKLYI
jgi:hypothetical protein